jgi:hypothetical protein
MRALAGGRLTAESPLFATRGTRSLKKLSPEITESNMNQYLFVIQALRTLVADLAARWAAPADPLQAEQTDLS